MGSSHFKVSESEVDSARYQTGRYMTQNLCLNCHIEGDNSIAPAFSEISKYYKKKSANHQDRKVSFYRFLKDPSAENSKNKSWIKKYGVMPNMSYTSSQRRNISYYLATTQLDDLEVPLTSDEMKKVQIDPIEKSLEIVLDTRSKLGGTLMNAISERGTKGAVEFCNIEAIPITLSQSKKHGVNLKRVTDRPRNPSNQASEMGLKYIEKFKKQHARGEEIEPVIVSYNEAKNFYSPILTNDNCLQCHGEVGNDINSNVYEKINWLYPDDLAIDYQAGEVRGAWKIQWVN